MVPKIEKELWNLDQEINDRGVKVDIQLIEKAIACDEQFNEKNKKMWLITRISDD